MLNCAPSDCCSSVLTFANRMSGWRAAAAANTGANARHGAHHGAQKSTSASGCQEIAFSNPAVSSSTTVPALELAGAVVSFMG